MSRRPLAALAALTSALALAGAAHAAYPGANGRIVFTSGASGTPQLETMAADGSGRAALGLAGTSPRFSPDGTRIAYAAGDAIWVAGADGAGARPVAAGSQASWSPDSARLAVVRAGELRLVALDGSSDTLLARGADRDPAWSPDGRTVLFVRGTPATAMDVWAARVDGSGETNLTRVAPGQRALAPAWSPDGTRIAFALDYSLSVMDADGGNRTALAALGRGSVVAWSPDGSQLVYEASGVRPSLGSALVVAAADGSAGFPGWQPSPEWLASPDWQPLPAAREAAAARHRPHAPPRRQRAQGRRI